MHLRPEAWMVQVRIGTAKCQSLHLLCCCKARNVGGCVVAAVLTHLHALSDVRHLPAYRVEYVRPPMEDRIPVEFRPCTVIRTIGVKCVVKFANGDSYVVHQTDIRLRGGQHEARPYWGASSAATHQQKLQEVVNSSVHAVLVALAAQQAGASAVKKGRKKKKTRKR
jgi:hypothetical protein